METKNTCANCRQTLDIGFDATKVDQGVMGVKGFVPLDSTLYFCSEDCLRDYYDLSNLPKVPPRIP